MMRALLCLLLLLTVVPSYANGVSHARQVRSEATIRELRDAIRALREQMNELRRDKAQERKEREERLQKMEQETQQLEEQQAALERKQNETLMASVAVKQSVARQDKGIKSLRWVVAGIAGVLALTFGFGAVMLFRRPQSQPSTSLAHIEDEFTAAEAAWKDVDLKRLQLPAHDRIETVNR